MYQDDPARAALAATTALAAINSPINELSVSSQHWAMTEALMAGTAAMRGAGQRFLPKFPAEEEAGWEARCKTATLFPAFRRTVTVMGGKPFSKPLTLSKEAPGLMVEWAENIDLEGTSLHVFARERFVESLAHGICGILIEAPKAPPTGARPRTVADEKAAKMRPYFVRINHGQLLGWRTGRLANGSTGLTQLRYKDDVMEDVGDYGQRLVERVRVLRPGSWEIWKRVKANDLKDDWVLDDSGTTELDYIPFVPIYGRRVGFMVGISPLLDVAYLNVKHWQSQSDQDTILHMARVPILLQQGGDPKTKITIGSSSAVQVPVGGDLKWVEHSGKAIEAGQNSINALEGQMIQSGAELLVKKPGTRTATESGGDLEANKSELQALAEDLEDALDRALEIMAEMGGQPNTASAQVFKDFGVFSLGEASGTLVMAMQQGGIISKQTAINEMKRRGELAPEIDPEEELEAVEEEGPALGEIEEPDDPEVDLPKPRPTPQSKIIPGG